MMSQKVSWAYVPHKNFKPTLILANKVGGAHESAQNSEAPNALPNIQFLGQGYRVILPDNTDEEKKAFYDIRPIKCLKQHDWPPPQL